MTSSNAARVRSYYDELRERTDLAKIAGELLAGRQTGEAGETITFDCPNHASTSKRSLYVNPSLGRFGCWGCDVRGDGVDFVEFIRFGVVSSGGVKATETHRQARDELAARVGMDSLAKHGLSAEKIASIEGVEREKAMVFGALTRLAEIQHERLFGADAPAEVVAVRERFADKYGIADETARSLRIGLGSDADFARLSSLGLPTRLILSTGAFYEPGTTYLDGRIVFPYWSNGRVVYMIGRVTQLTRTSRAKAKYWKLLVRGSDGRNDFVSPHVSNETLYGEDILRTKPKTVLITEGITDAIVGQQAGFPTISPVTARIADRDIQRIAPKLAGVERVVIIQDNEVSGVGIRAAIKNARLLGERDVDALVAKIPLDEEQVRAREELGEVLGGIERLADLEDAKPIDQGKLIAGWLSGSGPEVLKRVEVLRAKSKTDIAEWMRKRKPEDLGRLIASARHPIAWAIEHAPDPRPGSEDGLLPAESPLDPLADVLDEIARLDSGARDRFIDLVKQKTKTTKKEIEAKVRELAQRHETGKKKKATSTGEREDARREVLAIRSDTCRALLDDSVQTYRRREMSIDWKVIGEAIFLWFREAGARFYYSRDDSRVRMFWSGAIVEVGPSSTDFLKVMFAAAGVAGVSTQDRELLRSFELAAANDGRSRALPFSWNERATGEGGAPRIYISLGAGADVAVIDPKGVSLAKNGMNDDEVVLVDPSSFDPIEVSIDIDPDPLDAELDRTFGRLLACDPAHRRFVADYVATIPLISFLGSRPVLRFQGSSSSGKSFAGKVLTTFVFGHAKNVEATTAALWSMAATDPLVSIDNVEGDQVERESFRQFLLTSATQAARVKRRGGTDTGTVSEASNAFVLTTGIESFGGALREIMSRTFVVPFGEEWQQAVTIEEGEILRSVAASRPRLWSMIFARIAIVLDLIHNKRAIPRVHASLSARFGRRHPKARLNEFLVLAYLQRVAAADPDRREGMLDEIDPSFVPVVSSLISESQASERESSPLVGAVEALFTTLRGIGGSHPDVFGISLPIGTSKVGPVRSAVLYNALTKLKRDLGIPFPYRDAKHLGERLVESHEVLAAAGIRVERTQDRSRTNVYTITFDPDSSTPLFDESDRPGGGHWRAKSLAPEDAAEIARELGLGAAFDDEKESSK